MGFWSWHLHFPGVKPEEAHSRGSEMAADGKDGRACCLRLEVCGGLFIDPPRSTLRPSPPTLLTVSQGSLALWLLLGLAKGKHSLGSEDGWGVGLGVYLSPSQCCFQLAASLYWSHLLLLESLSCSSLPASSSRPGASNSSPEMLVPRCCTILRWFP